MTRAGASEAKSMATRNGLESGFRATAEPDKLFEQDALTESKFMEKVNQMKKEVTEAGSGPAPPSEVSDQLETSPITEKAAATLP